VATVQVLRRLRFQTVEGVDLLERTGALGELAEQSDGGEEAGL
jgi:hypothetical protein